MPLIPPISCSTFPFSPYRICQLIPLFSYSSFSYSSYLVFIAFTQMECTLVSTGVFAFFMEISTQVVHR